MPPKSKSSVRVYIRVRPFNAREQSEPKDGHPALQVIGNAVRLYNRKTDAAERAADFTFDHCFDSCRGGAGAQQADVYGVVGKEVLANARDGYNACLFAYGQTGSGKTYTMMGDIDGPERGVIPRLCGDLFDQLAGGASGPFAAHTTTVQASYLEIYCERVYDLLCKEQSDLQVRQHPEKGPFVEGLTSHPVTSLEQVIALMHKGAKHRATCATLMNTCSSRSHAIFMLNYTQTFYVGTATEQKVQARSKASRIYLVDLAGSERTKASGVTGQNLEEAKKINLSLSTLGRVIDLLADRQTGKPCVLPVRESLLTWLLADSLGGNSKTIMLAAVSPAGSSYEETLSTLRYAARTKCIVNEASINETLDLKMVSELRGQIDNLQELLRAQQRSREGEINSLEGQLQAAVGRAVELEWQLEEGRRAAQRAEEERQEAQRDCARLQAELSRAADGAHHLQVLYDAAAARKTELEAALTAAQAQVAEAQAGRQRAAADLARQREETEALRRRATDERDELRRQLEAAGKDGAAVRAALRQMTQKAGELEGTLQTLKEQTARDRHQQQVDAEAAAETLRQRLDKERAEEANAARHATQQMRVQFEQQLREAWEEAQRGQEAVAKLQARCQGAVDDARSKETALAALQQQHRKELEQVRADHAQALAAVKRSHDTVLADVQAQINERWQQRTEGRRAEAEEGLREERAAAQRAAELKAGKMAAHIRDLQAQLRSAQETHQRDVQDLGSLAAALQAVMARHDQACHAAAEQARAAVQRLEAARAAGQKDLQTALQQLPAHLEWVTHPSGRRPSLEAAPALPPPPPPPGRLPDMMIVARPTMAARRHSDIFSGPDSIASPTALDGPGSFTSRRPPRRRSLGSVPVIGEGAAKKTGGIARLESPRTPATPQALTPSWAEEPLSEALG